MLGSWLNKLIEFMRTGYKHIIILLVAHMLLFTIIGMVTTNKPSSRLASSMFSSWTSNFDSSVFLTFLRFENHSFDLITTKHEESKPVPTILFEIMTSIKMNDIKSFLSYEIPGFSTYEHKVIVRGEGMGDEQLLSHESGPPLEDILEDREAIDDDEEEKTNEKPEKNIEEATVFLYNSHNRESFLPHLPDESNADNAHHKEVNVMKVSDHMAESLEKNGIGSIVDDTDIMNVLQENGWSYPKSYDASRSVVKDVLDQHDEIKYAFDIHRDSLPRDRTLKEINGTDYASILFIIGAENKQYEKNLAVATELHYMLEEAYPGLSKGVVTKEGANSNGVYNQDLLDTSMLIEIGGYENTLDEMYRSADAIAEVFTEFYFDAEKVDN